MTSTAFCPSPHAALSAHIGRQTGLRTPPNGASRAPPVMKVLRYDKGAGYMKNHGHPQTVPHLGGRFRRAFPLPRSPGGGKHPAELRPTDRVRPAGCQQTHSAIPAAGAKYTGGSVRLLRTVEWNSVAPRSDTDTVRPGVSLRAVRCPGHGVRRSFQLILRPAHRACRQTG